MRVTIPISPLFERATTKHHHGSITQRAMCRIVGQIELNQTAAHNSSMILVRWRKQS